MTTERVIKQMNVGVVWVFYNKYEELRGEQFEMSEFMDWLISKIRPDVSDDTILYFDDDSRNWMHLFFSMTPDEAIRLTLKYNGLFEK